MTLFHLQEPWNRIYAVHGPTYDRLRPGGYWGMSDELFWHAKASTLGFVWIFCIDLEDADRLGARIEGYGLVAGRDFAVQSVSGEVIETPEIRWSAARLHELMDGQWREALARIEWNPGPPPAAHADFVSRLEDPRYDVQWPVRRELARMLGTSPDLLAQADRQPTDELRCRFLMEARVAKMSRAEDSFYRRYPPRMLSQTTVGGE